MNKKRKILIFLTILIVIATLGLTYTLFTSNITSGNKVAIAGDIYMKLNGSDRIELTNVIPMTKEEALEKTDNIFNFQIVGKNTSNKDIYYGISLETGEVPDGKTEINPSDLVVYLESDGNILVDGVRYQDFKSHVYVDTIPKNTTSNIEKDYSLRVWLRDGIIVSDTVKDATYTLDEWNNIYMSLKVKVDGNMSYMNMPLSIEHDNESVENNKQFFIATIMNFLNPDELGETIIENETMKLEVESVNSNILFSYKDSRGNLVEDVSNALTIDYIFNKKESIETQVFITPLNDAPINTDIKVKLTTNDNKVYTQVINLDIKGTNYCLSNGFNKLTDCILVSENLSSNVQDAKEYISSKTYSLNDTAPSYTYVEDVTYDVENPSHTIAHILRFSDSYTFNEKTGNFSLTNTILTDYTISEKYIGKFICKNSTGTSDCDSILKIISISDSENKILKADVYTSKVTSTLRSEEGLYKTVDDNGDTYFFRGDVKNNNVYFGGYYWKIVRINGDGAIRLIYNGEIKDANEKKAIINETIYTYGNYINSDIGVIRSDPTYVGYMYGENFSEEEIISNNIPYTGINISTKYYFASSYQYDEKTRTFKLLGDDIQNKTYSEMQSENLLELYPYTCFETDKTENCQLIRKIVEYQGETKILYQYISHSSKNLDGTRTNDFDSNVKKVLDEWYLKNIVSQVDDNSTLLTNYIVDGTFCNERGIGRSGDGYNLYPTTFYKAADRLEYTTNVNTSLKCGDDIRDIFSKTEKYGNAKLTYPTALLTADEIVLAGGKVGLKNNNFYLNCNMAFWTMTPSHFATDNGYIFTLRNEGNLTSWNPLDYLWGLRPVINISKDVLISSGDGSKENPYILKLA